MDDSVLSFKTLQHNILIPYCKNCHFAENSKPENDPIDFSSYDKMMVKDRFIPLLIKGKPLKSRLYTSVHSGKMPKRQKLSDSDIEYIKRWIEACAPNETIDEIPNECPKETTPEDDDFGDDEFNNNNNEF